MQINRIDAAPKLPSLLRVAAYARVSNGKESMLHSLSAQVDYYTEYIQRNPQWAFAGVFVDEARTGTKDSRPEFQRMLAECRAGNIQMIVTKAISRFARNTVTVLSSVRELKALGVDVFFEEQGIYSLSAEGEVMLTILASYAQEESLSASENQKWRIRKNFQEGKVGGMRMFGYRLADGILAIIPEEAETVRQIFADYLSGMGVNAIMKKLRNQGVKISQTALSEMLRQEKYQGDMRLQKSFVENHITKRRVKNIGQLPMFYVSGSHTPIIDRDTFAAVQTEIARRAVRFSPKMQIPAVYPFTGLIRCGICDAPYRRKHAASGTKYEKIVWICDTFNTLGKAACASQQIPEDILSAKINDAGGINHISRIIVPGKNQLVIILKDGTIREIEWTHPSRSQSWTPEMREAARQKAYERNNRNET